MAEVQYAPLNHPAKSSDVGLIKDHLQYSEVTGFKQPKVRHTTILNCIIVKVIIFYRRKDYTFLFSLAILESPLPVTMKFQDVFMMKLYIQICYLKIHPLKVCIRMCYCDSDFVD